MDTFVIPQHNLRKFDFQTESPQTIMPDNDNDNFYIIKTILIYFYCWNFS